MQDVFEFLTRCRNRLHPLSAINGLIKDAPTPRRKIVNGVFDLFTTGYNAALETDAETLAKHLAGIDYIDRSVMLEGSYAAYASMDLKQGDDWSKLQQLMAEAIATENPVAIHEGIGHALCQQRIEIDFIPHVTATFWGWMAVDGYGCHAAYFRWPDVIEKQKIPECLDEIGQKAFDQGVGRGIWLMGAADPKTINRIVCSFPYERRADMWSGIGMMIGMWGADDSTDMRRFLLASKRWRPWLQLGVAFSTLARHQAGKMMDYTKDACHVICKSDDVEALEVATKSLEALDGPPTTSQMFGQWKDFMAQEFSSN